MDTSQQKHEEELHANGCTSNKQTASGLHSQLSPSALPSEKSPLIHPSLPPPPSSHISLVKPAYHDAKRLYATFSTFAHSFPPLRKALSIIDSALRLYTPENLAVAFNGGKDATVVMHLARAAVANWSEHNNQPARLHCLYLLGASGENFPEVNAFVRRQVAECELDGVEVELGIKEGICEFVKHRKGTCAFVMGTRRADPYSASMEHFEPSSEGWPPFMRVNPIISWDYHHVWEFLRRLELPYCSLYDHGYTSIGSIATTQPNPALAETRNSDIIYQPAWMLKDESKERAGRQSKRSSS